jgi:hypothetical protein
MLPRPMKPTFSPAYCCPDTENNLQNYTFLETSSSKRLASLKVLSSEMDPDEIRFFERYLLKREARRFLS